MKDWLESETLGIALEPQGDEGTNLLTRVKRSDPLATEQISTRQ